MGAWLDPTQYPGWSPAMPSMMLCILQTQAGTTVVLGIPAEDGCQCIDRSHHCLKVKAKGLLLCARVHAALCSHQGQQGCNQHGPRARQDAKREHYPHVQALHRCVIIGPYACMHARVSVGLHAPRHHIAISIPTRVNIRFFHTHTEVDLDPDRLSLTREKVCSTHII